MGRVVQGDLLGRQIHLVDFDVVVMMSDLFCLVSCKYCIAELALHAQSGASDRLLGFEDEASESSHGWWAVTVATSAQADGGTTQILIFETLRMIGRPAQ